MAGQRRKMASIYVNPWHTQAIENLLEKYKEEHPEADLDWDGSWDDAEECDTCGSQLDDEGVCTECEQEDLDEKARRFAVERDNLRREDTHIDGVPGPDLDGSIKEK